MAYKQYIHNLSPTAEGKRVHDSPTCEFEDYINTRVKSVAHQDRIYFVAGVGLL